MPTYNYKVKDWQGNTREGSYRAGSVHEAAGHLHALNYTILKLKEQAGQALLTDALKSGKREKIKPSHYMVFCRHFATMTIAGFTVLKSLHVLGLHGENAILREKIKEVAFSVEKGCTIAESMNEFPDVFPSIMTNMIAAGETGGMLGEVLERLAQHFERQSDLEEKMRSAMTYPIVISVVALVVLAVMIFFVLPIFSNMFINMGAELPLLTQAILGFGNFVMTYWLVFLLIMVGFIAVLKLNNKAGYGGLLLDQMKLRFPVFSTLYIKVVVSRFARSLSSLLSSGVDILGALDLVDKLTDNRVFNEALIITRRDISHGHTMAGSLKKSGLFPPMMVEMIRVGEETGCLSEMLSHSADLYEREVTYGVDRIASIIEPAVLVFVGLFVGILVVSLILPMFQIYDGI